MASTSTARRRHVGQRGHCCKHHWHDPSARLSRNDRWQRHKEPWGPLCAGHTSGRSGTIRAFWRRAGVSGTGDKERFVPRCCTRWLASLSDGLNWPDAGIGSEVADDGSSATNGGGVDWLHSGRRGERGPASCLPAAAILSRKVAFGVGGVRDGGPVRGIARTRPVQRLVVL